MYYFVCGLVVYMRGHLSFLSGNALSADYVLTIVCNVVLFVVSVVVLVVVHVLCLIV